MYVVQKYFVMNWDNRSSSNWCLSSTVLSWYYRCR